MLERSDLQSDNPPLTEHPPPLFHSEAVRLKTFFNLLC